MTDPAETNRTPVKPETAPLRLAVLISGGGRTLLNLADLIDRGELPARIVAVVSSRDDAAGVERARQRGLPTYVVSRKAFDGVGEFSEAVWEVIGRHAVDLVCMAGFLSLLRIPPAFAGRVINIHPSLLPRHGGKGMFGRHVHEAVLAAGDRESGCTVHFADAEYDQGPIILQRRCAVEADDTPDTLAARVYEQELRAYPEAIRMIQRGEVPLGPDRQRHP